MIQWKYPMKPVCVTEAHFAKLDPDQYSMELKFDGWRSIVVSGPEGPSLWTRDKVRIEMPNNILEQLVEMKLPTGTILDGEIWNPLNRGGWRHNRSVQCKITIWDIIRMGDLNVGHNPIEFRREALKSILRPTPDIGMVQVLPATRAEYDRALKEAKEFRTENSCRSGFIHGVVLKRNKSVRRDHATRCVEHPDWLKVLYPGMKGWEPR